MSLISLASAESIWRGYNYFKENKVIKLDIKGENLFSALISGSGEKVYNVTIDLEHPYFSKCDCPHANGRRIICKHKVAVYFTAFPEEAEAYYNSIIEDEENYIENEEDRGNGYEYEDDDENEKVWEEMWQAVFDYVYEMNKSELQHMLLELLFSGPKWQCRHFIREYIDPNF